MSLYRRLIRPALFQLDAERAHQLALTACRIAQAVPGLPRLASITKVVDARLRSEVAGLNFANPIGLAAGWDKSGVAIPFLQQLGFGAIEVGSISSAPSLGNPKPRLHRLPIDQAIIVNYGLPNDGASKVERRLRRLKHQPPRDVPLGINLVKTNRGAGSECDVADVYEDYRQSVERLHPFADYLMLNLSCPNAAGSEDFFSVPGRIETLLQTIKPTRIGCPVFLKIAPETNPRALDQLLSEVASFDFVRGFQFNLPSRKPDNLRSPSRSWQPHAGAVSGKPAAPLIDRCIRALYRQLDPKRHSIIASGGVFTAEDAYHKLRLGASLVQVYTALIYEGPSVVNRINRGLCRLLDRDNVASIREVVGSGDGASD